VWPDLKPAASSSMTRPILVMSHPRSVPYCSPGPSASTAELRCI
jgi:hypothetical protein